MPRRLRRGFLYYLFNCEYARRPLRFPAQLVDFCLELRAANQAPLLGEQVSFAEVDWVYCLSRAVRQSGHRFDEAQNALESFAARYLDFLDGLDTARHDGWNDLHLLFGALCCLAELQSALPGQLLSEKPLLLVLDRRPFI